MAISQQYLFPGMMGTGLGMRAGATQPGVPRTGGPAPVQGRQAGGIPSSQPPARVSPPGLGGGTPPGMMGSMRTATPQPPQLAPGQAMTLPKADPAGFRAEAPNKVGRPPTLRT